MCGKPGQENLLRIQELSSRLESSLELYKDAAVAGGIQDQDLRRLSAAMASLAGALKVYGEFSAAYAERHREWEQLFNMARDRVSALYHELDERGAELFRKLAP